MDFNTMIQVIPAAIIGLTVHEFAHAYTAYRLGDSTAKDQGRVTLNPIKHIDWLGFILIIIVGFGWAKPVQFNPDNLKKRHRDEILISLAGPFSNFVLAFLFVIAARIVYSFDVYDTVNGAKAIDLLLIFGVMNIGLAIFNLIPIPPLDGSHVYMTYLQKSNPELMFNLYKYGTWGLLGIIILENQLDLNILHLSEIINFVYGFILNLVFF